MTKVSYLAGIPEDEKKDRAKQVPNKPFFPVNSMTKGELRLALYREQFRILAAYYPEDRIWKQGVSIIDNALYRGVHAIGATHVGSLPGRLLPLLQQIKKAKKEIQPANNQFLISRNQIGNDPLVDLLNCDPLQDDINDLLEQINQYQTPPADLVRLLGDKEAALQACEEENEMRDLLNEYLEESAHHLLYEWVGNANAEPPIVATKTTLHKIGQDRISQASGIDDDLVRLWMRNGIMRQNAKKEIGPLQPEQTIQALKENAGESIGIDPATIIAIFTIIAAAAKAASAIIQAIKQTKPQQAQLFADLQGIGTKPWGPEAADWQLPPGSVQNPDGSITLPDGTTIQPNGKAMDPATLLLIGGGVLLASDIL